MTTEPRTTDLSGAVVPRALGTDEVVIVDGAAVLYRAGAVHSLNPTATLVWESCDGETTLEGLADELASAFGIERATARRDVIGVAGELLERDLISVVPETVESRDAVVDDSLGPVFQPSAACSGCGEGPTYECQLIVASGAVRVSVGADRVIVGALHRAFGTHVVEVVETPRDRASYGVVLPSAPRHAGVMELSRLHRGPDVLLTSRDPERVLRAVVAQVALHSVVEPQVRLDAVAVGNRERAVVMAAPANRNGYARDAARYGLSLSDTTAITVDVQTGTVVNGPTWRDLDLDALFEVASDRRHLGAEPPPLPWGRLELVGLVVEGPPDAGSVLGEMGGGVAWDRPSPLRVILDAARTVPVRSGTTADEIAGWLGVG